MEWIIFDQVLNFEKKTLFRLRSDKLQNGNLSSESWIPNIQIELGDKILYFWRKKSSKNEEKKWNVEI